MDAKKMIILLINKLKVLRIKMYQYVFQHKPIENNKVIIWADSFKHFGCSPKYIVLYILRYYREKFKIVWVFDSKAEIPKDFPKEIQIVRYFSLDYLREIATAKFIICNARTNRWHFFEKRIGQIYIQTWHSSLRLKKIEGDAIPGIPEDYIKAAKADSHKIDLLLSGCDFSTEIFRRAFWYSGEILKCGTPRCDVFFNGDTEIKKKVFRYYDIPFEKKLVLYAPTFRNNRKADVYGMVFSQLKNTLETVYGNGWVIGCRLHPNIMENVGLGEASISMSDYSDMQELIFAADILITDYSSCMFDMAIANKPCLLYVPDLESYLERERGLYFNLEELPFPIAHDMQELCRNVKNFNSHEYSQQIVSFLDRIGTYESGTAARQVVEYMIEKL